MSSVTKSVSRKTTVTHSESSAGGSASTGRGRTQRKSERKSFSRSEQGASPTRIRRENEKEEFQSLNDRLAVYIDTVRRLENENNQLRFQVEKHEETRTKEVISVKNLYENELEKVRKLLDDISKEKNQLQYQVDKLADDVKELQTKNNKLELALRGKTKALNDAEAKLAEISPKLEDALKKNKALNDENRDLRSENDTLTKRLADTQKKLEAETLLRADLQNQLTTCREQIAFREQEHETQIREVQSRKTIEISEIDGKVREMHDEYERKIQEAVQTLRQEHEENLRESLVEMQDRYEDKIEELNNYRTNVENDHYKLRQELVSSRGSTETLRKKITDLESQNLDLQNKIRELETRLEDERIAHLDAIRIRDDEIRRLNEINDANNLELNELMAIKLSLDAELATYRKMLEGEEARLNITPGATPGPSSGTPLRGARSAKRKRTLLESSEESEHSQMQSTATASHKIEICEDDMDGKFIKIHNKGDENIPLVGYVLKRTVGDEVVSFKFGRNANSLAGQDVSVWSTGSDVTASAENIVMRNKSWIVGDNISTVLSNKEGEEIARRDSMRKHESSSYLIEATGRGSSRRGIELHHQQGDPANREQCVVM